MTEIRALVKRNTKLFFKDKGLFFTSLITPMILLVLYMSFLANVYRDSYVSALGGIDVSDEIIGGLVGGQLVSSLLAVCTVTVAFCSNMLMVQDKVNGQRKDLCVSPVKNHTLALSYYISTGISTLIISVVAMIAGLVYLNSAGWFLSVGDILLVLLDVFLLVMFGTALSSIINVFLSSQGQISAVGTIVSSGYGFLCGAYMPISQFGEGLQNVVAMLPGTYGTALLRNHMLGPVFDEMRASGVAEELVDAFYDLVDCNIYFFDTSVSRGAMMAILSGTVAVLILVYIVINKLKKN